MTAGSGLEDREVLLRLYQATGGKSWKRHDGWGTNDNVGSWFGVFANDEGRVQTLNVQRNNLSGELPKELGDLVSIQTLDMSGNKIRGDIPKELGNLRSVKHLHLNDNHLSGHIPEEIGHLPRLAILELQRNDLTGEIPKQLGDLVSVKALDLSENQLSGDIPKELGHLPAVEALYLTHNQLTGVIPKELGHLPVVVELNLSSNNLSGEIPKELGDLPAVKWLDLSSNQLSGKLPKKLGELATLERLSLQGNDLSEVPLAFLQALLKRESPSNILNVADNTSLRPPHTTMGLGIDHAIAWWKDIERFGEGTSNKLKMVLVGLAEAGKTTLVRNITGRPVPNILGRTVGIQITPDWKPLDGGPLEISIWDFAGQADYYASHQLFLTEGSLFLLVVDLRALFMESASGVEKGGDPKGRVYRWLEMLHLRVPGAAVALVGTHTDAAEFRNSAELDKAVSLLEQCVARYREDNAKEAAKAVAMNSEGASGPKTGMATMRRKSLLKRQTSSLRALRAPGPLCIHDKVFRTSIDRDSTKNLKEWISNAATLVDCPTGFNFPAVRATIPQVWIDANSAMDNLRVGAAGKRYVTWREAVQTFGNFMETKGTPIPDPEAILLRAMRHREAEGGVLLTLEHDPPRLGESAGMLYLDPTWLIEVIRRLTDHSLGDPAKEGTLKNELDMFGEEQKPPLELGMLWDQHRSYRASGTLNLPYLRFLWLHRQLDDGLKLDLSPNEFRGVLSTMETLLVVYRASTNESTSGEVFVVPSRLPEYGDEQVLETGSKGLGDSVVRTMCSFRQSYAPPGVIGHFLAFVHAHILEARQCWQHGAHLIWTPGGHEVLLYETQSVERSDTGSVSYPGLALCVKGNTPAVRETLESLKAEVRRLFQDKVHGYPGLCSVVFEDTREVKVSDLTSELRKYLETRFEQLGALVGKVATVTSGVLEAFYLAGDDENQYPRLLIMKPDDTPPPEQGARKSRKTVASSPTCTTTGGEVTAVAASAEWMQRDTWDKWIRAWTERRQFRMVFLCEHDMTEVKCGPDGKGYRIRNLPQLVKTFLPLLTVSLHALRVAVGMVSHVDLPLHDLLEALAKSASTEFLGAMGKTCSIPGLAETSALADEATGAEDKEKPQRLQKESYGALCQYMKMMEQPSSSCCGWRFKCSSCGSARSKSCTCKRWRDVMVRVRNGKGGLVWVKKTNEAAYKQKIAEEAKQSRASI